MNTSNSAGIRTKSTILVKPFAEGRPFNCFESNFRANTDGSRRVNRLHDSNLGLRDCTEEEFNRLRGNQPVFYLMETYGPDGRWQWNGRLLYSTKDCKAARALVRDHSSELHIIMAFEDSYNGHFFFLVETDATDFSDESYLAYSKKTFRAIRRYLPKVSYHQPNFYVRCLPEHCYEVLDRDALFGKPEINFPDEDTRTCQTMSVGEILNRFFGNIFNRSAL